MRVKDLIAAFAAVTLLAACASDDAADEPQVVSTESSTPSSDTAGGPTPGTQEDLVQKVGDRVFYEFDQFDLTPQGRQTVEGWAGWLRQYPQVSVTIEGHADERGTREYNLALGERRATSARNYLVALGIEANRISTVSYGKERPAVVGSNEYAWSQNRRAVMVVQ